MSEEIRRLVVLGSTGSIGRQTLDIVRALPERFDIIGLAAGSNSSLLLQQIKEFRPGYYCTSSEEELAAGDCRFMPLENMARHPDADIVVIATSGTAGMNAVLTAVQAGKTIALANKESLVAAGEMIIAELKKHNARILPVDSEHSAIWQCLKGENLRPRRILLTASGGPFRGFSEQEMEAITVEQALNHPSWRMGKKVTVDSATLMNKGLEVIEAHWLFDVPFDDIKVLVHPGSIIHSMVEFEDGSVKAQLSSPDMHLPIQYALTFPDRLTNPALPSIDWDNLAVLSFEPPDTLRFPCLRLAIEAGKEGGTSPVVLCAADEAAGELFLSGRIGFTEIAFLVQQILERHVTVHHPSMEEITAADTWARDTVLRIAGGGE